MAEERDRWRAVVNAVMNLWVLYKFGHSYSTEISRHCGQTVWAMSRLYARYLSSAVWWNMRESMCPNRICQLRRTSGPAVLYDVIVSNRATQPVMKAARVARVRPAPNDVTTLSILAESKLQILKYSYSAPLILRSTLVTICTTCCNTYSPRRVEGPQFEPRTGTPAILRFVMVFLGSQRQIPE